MLVVVLFFIFARFLQWAGPGSSEGERVHPRESVGFTPQIPAQVGHLPPPLHCASALPRGQVEALGWDRAGCLPLRSPRPLTPSAALHTGLLPSSVLGRNCPDLPPADFGPPCLLLLSSLVLPT